jgi:hypothetical protein
MLGCFEKRNEIPDSKSGKEFLYDWKIISFNSVKS